MIPTFGQTIRAARMGYRWLDKLQMFVRVCILDSDRIAVYLRDRVVDGRAAKDEPAEHSCWWEGDDSVRRALVKALHGKPAGMYFLDYDGRLMP